MGATDVAECGASDAFGAEVIHHHLVGLDNTATDPTRAEGPPDCTTAAQHDVSLGGGGFLVFDLGCHVTPHAGPELAVWESDGACPSAISEEYFVSVSADDATYIEVGKGFGSQMFEVTGQAFRYVRIDDRSDITSGGSPGADIDALQVLVAP